jgi:hypothetical protein
MGLRKRCFLFNYLFINLVQEPDFEFEISQWQPWKYFKWKMGMYLLPEWISIQWVVSVKCFEDYGGIFMCMRTNENSSCVQNLKLILFSPAPHYISLCAAAGLLSIMCSEIVRDTHKHLSWLWFWRLIVQTFWLIFIVLFT